MITARVWNSIESDVYDGDPSCRLTDSETMKHDSSREPLQFQNDNRLEEGSKEATSQGQWQRTENK